MPLTSEQEDQLNHMFDDILFKIDNSILLDYSPDLKPNLTKLIQFLQRDCKAGNTNITFIETTRDHLAILIDNVLDLNKGGADNLIDILKNILQGPATFRYHMHLKDFQFWAFIGTALTATIDGYDIYHNNKAPKDPVALAFFIFLTLFYDVFMGIVAGIAAAFYREFNIYRNIKKMSDSVHGFFSAMKEDKSFVVVSRTYYDLAKKIKNHSNHITKDYLMADIQNLYREDKIIAKDMLNDLFIQRLFDISIVNNMQEKQTLREFLKSENELVSVSDVIKSLIKEVTIEQKRHEEPVGYVPPSYIPPPVFHI